MLIAVIGEKMNGSIKLGDKMKLLLQTLFLLGQLVLSSGLIQNVHAAAEKNFSYTGQNAETFTLENLLTETRYRTETVPDTCTRQIPYNDRVCGNETRYREECRPVAGYEHCENVPDRECRDVTRYREECHPGPSRRICHPGPDRQVCEPGPSHQVCRDIPGTQTCRPGPSRQVCENQPGRQVCENKPGRRVCERGPSREVCTNGPETEKCEDVIQNKCEIVNGRRVCRRVTERVCRKVPGERTCRQVPGEEVCRQLPGERVCRQLPGERVCRTVPGEQICTTTPPRRECHNEPGRQICRMIPGEPVCHQEPGQPVCRRVAYNDTECRDILRRECRWIPPTTRCDRVPYDEYVCRDVTLYRSEPYPCTRTVQVPYTVTVKKFIADIDVEFNHPAREVRADFIVGLTREGELQIKAIDRTNDQKLLVLAKRATRRDGTGTSEEKISARYLVSFENEEILSPVSSPISKVKLHKDKLSFVIGRVKYPELLKINLVVKRKGSQLLEKVLTHDDFELSNSSDGSKIIVSLNKFGLDTKWLHKYQFDISVNIDFQGRVINASNPVTRRDISIDKIQW